MGDGELDAKTVRHVYTALEQTEARLSQLGTMVHRIYYKNKAQHRRAKWFQSMDGIRKCLKRLLDMDRITIKMDDSLPDRGLGAKKAARMETRSVGVGGAGEARVATVVEAKQAVGRVWCSLWAEEGDGSDRLAKYSTPPVCGASRRVSLLAAFKLLVVCVQLEELARRAQTAFHLMEVHMRTPPAPTFAPLVLSLMSVCGQVHSQCLETLWWESNKRAGLASLYSNFVSVEETEGRGTLILDCSEEVNRSQWEKTLNMIHLADERALGWMPKTLAQSTAASRPGLGGVKGVDGALAAAVQPSQPGMAEEEDLGEAMQ